MASVFEVSLGEVSLAADDYSFEWDCYMLKTGAVQAIWIGADAVDGEVKLQESVNKEAWYDATTAAVMATATGARLWKLDLYSRWYRVKVEHKSNTAGTVYITAIGKP